MIYSASITQATDEFLEQTDLAMVFLAIVVITLIGMALVLLLRGLKIWYTAFCISFLIMLTSLLILGGYVLHKEDNLSDTIADHVATQYSVEHVEVLDMLKDERSGKYNGSVDVSMYDPAAEEQHRMTLYLNETFDVMIPLESPDLKALTVVEDSEAAAYWENVQESVEDTDDETTDDESDESPEQEADKPADEDRPESS